MRLTNISYKLALLASVLAAEKSDVNVLSAENFDSFVKSHDLVLAEFYAPWCGHCKNLAPEFEEAATTLKETDLDFALAKIDCDDNRNFCMQQDVEGFPTLYIYEQGERLSSYSGPRKAADIVSRMKLMAEPAVSDVQTVKELESLLEDYEKSDLVTFLYLGPEDHLDVVTKVAKDNRENLKFLSSQNKDIKKQYESDLIVFKPNEKPTLLSKSQPISDARILNFVKDNEFPTFADLGPSNYARYIESGVPMLYAFVTSDDDRELFVESITPFVDQLKGKANVVFLDANKFGAHAQNVNLKEEFPAMVVHEVDSNKKYVHTQDVELTAETVKDFLTKFLNDEITPSIKSQPVPTQTGPVYTLVGSEYDKVVLDTNKDVLVMFYAPWCGHCKNLKPTYEKLAEKYADKDNVIIAMLEHTENDVPDRIAGYPTLKLYPADDKENPVEFKGPRDLDTLIEFVIENGSFHTEPTPEDEENDEADSEEKVDL